MITILFAVGFRYRHEILGIAAVFAYAAVFSMLLVPVCRRFEQLGMRTTWAAAISVMTFALLILLAAAVLIPYIATHTAALLKKNVPLFMALLEDANQWMERFGVEYLQWERLSETFFSGITQTTAKFARAGMRMAARAGRYAFAIVIAYYLLCERRAAANHVMLVLPLPYRRLFQQTMIGCRNAAMGYFSGMVKTSLFIFCATYAGLLLLRIPDALLLAFFMALFEILPYLGPVIASIPILLSAIPLGMERALYALILLIAVQQIEGNFVAPHFAATSTSIHPFAALVGVFVFGSILGIWGILMAIPVMVIARSILWSIRQTKALSEA